VTALDVDLDAVAEKPSRPHGGGTAELWDWGEVIIDFSQAAIGIILRWWSGLSAAGKQSAGPLYSKSLAKIDVGESLLRSFGKRGPSRAFIPARNIPRSISKSNDVMSALGLAKRLYLSNLFCFYPLETTLRDKVVYEHSEIRRLSWITLNKT